MRRIEQAIGRKFIKKINQDKEVIAALLFGSFLKQKRYGDVDVCLVLDKRYGSSFIYDKRLSYLTISKDMADVQIFQQLPLYVRAEILREGKVLLCKDTRLLYDIAFDTIKEFELFKAKYKDYISRELLV